MILIMLTPLCLRELVRKKIEWFLYICFGSLNVQEMIQGLWLNKQETPNKYRSNIEAKHSNNFTFAYMSPSFMFSKIKYFVYSF